LEVSNLFKEKKIKRGMTKSKSKRIYQNEPEYEVEDNIKCTCRRETKDLNCKKHGA
jgi:hypothetical protein